ncbi:MAG: LTA synthase family protein [Clostridia bacterium]|nr:LTA synthase family protein [Clostridia bacterium]
MKKENLKLPSVKSCLKAIFYTALTVMPFLLMDFFIRVLARDVRYFQAAMVLPNILFTVLWISLLSIIPRCFKGELGRIIYAVFFLIFFSAFVANSIYYPYTEFFFGFNLLQSAQEGSAYIGDVVKNTDIITILKCLLVLAVGLLAIFKFPKSKRTRWKSMILFLAIFSVIYATVPGLLGQGNKSLKWDTWRNPRNVYDSFSDQNKNMKICGLFEYTVRDFYITFLMADSEQNPDEMELLENTYSEQTAHKKNKYTGFFKGKNVIFIQLEGMDSWLITPEDTPNIYGMLNNSLVFNNHYSYYTGGGSTFNSELAVSTGYITPVSYTKNPYSFTGNTFLYSLPRQLKNAGYTANAFHMNTGEYYTRDINYKNWGYDDYYSLLDDGNYEDASYQLDRELILNEFFYEKMFKQDSKFMHYIITYTPHTPFSINSETAKLILAELEGQEGEAPVVAESQPQAEEPAPEGETVEEGEEAEPQVSEEEVARLFASETDKMMGLLLQALKDNGLLRNTIIVAYADHYLYTLNDKTILDQYKTTENNLINETPFFIWSNGMRRRDFDKVNSQIDILPTVLNLLGIKYNDEWYIGRDIMDPDYQGYVFFSDRSWYDGVNYVENGVATNNPEADPQYIMDTNTHMNNLIQKNDLTLKYDFFKKKRE